MNDAPMEIFPCPKTVIRDYPKTHRESEIDRSIPQQIIITVAPDGYSRREQQGAQYANHQYVLRHFGIDVLSR